MSDILLITPPFIQWNTPYPAASQLCAFMKQQGFQASQMDLGIELILRIYSPHGLTALFNSGEKHPASSFFGDLIFQKNDYIQKAEFVVSFLQKPDPVVAEMIISEGFTV